MEPGLFDMALKGALILALTGVVAASSRSASAAARHLVWSIGLGAAVALPLVQWLLPDWSLAVLPVREAPAVSGSTLMADAPPRLAGGVAQLWLVGTAVTLGVFLVGRLRVRWIARAARPVDHGPLAALVVRLSGEIGLARRVRLLRGPAATMPMMWGIFRPVILLPPEADGWSPALQRDVLLHELAHVQRHDYLTQMVARLACALHWFDPLAWLAARRMRLERERACDDRVIAGGSSPCDYAEHLLAVARWRSTGVRAGALGMAGGSPLADRLRAVLEAGRTRRPVPVRRALGQIGVATLLVAGLATLHPEPIAAPADAADPGGVLPLPPSASAGLRSARAPEASASEARPEPAPAPGKAKAAKSARPAAKTKARATTASAVESARAIPESVRNAARSAVRIDRQEVRPALARVSHGAASQLLSRPRVVVGAVANGSICLDSKGAEPGNEAPIIPSRATLAAVPQPVQTP